MVAAELPAIPVSAGALIFDQAGRLLILKPTYKTGWTIPGGIVEADGETPWDACRREVLEECGIEVSSGRLACTDYRPGRPGHPGARAPRSGVHGPTSASCPRTVAVAQTRLADRSRESAFLRTPCSAQSSE